MSFDREGHRRALQSLLSPASAGAASRVGRRISTAQGHLRKAAKAVKTLSPQPPRAEGEAARLREENARLRARVQALEETVRRLEAEKAGRREEEEEEEVEEEEVEQQQEEQQQQHALASPAETRAPPANPESACRSAVRIQSAYRGHLERRALTAERELSRLPLDQASTPLLHRRAEAALALPDGPSRLDFSSPAPAARPEKSEEQEEEEEEAAPREEVREEQENEPVAEPKKSRRAARKSGLPQRRGAGHRKRASVSLTQRPAGAASHRRVASEAAVPATPGGGALAAELRKRRKVLRNTDSSWGLRVAAMNEVEAMYREGGADRSATLAHDLELLRKCVAAQLEDLRSSIVREACRLVVSVAETCGGSEGFADFFAPLLPVLFRRLYVTIKAISETADQCVKTVLQRASSPGLAARCVPRLVRAASTDTHAMVRFRCCEYLTLVLVALPDVEAVAPLREDVLAVTAKTVSDSDKNARCAARHLFLAAAMVWPDDAARLEGTLPASARRAIDKDRACLGADREQ